MLEYKKGRRKNTLISNYFRVVLNRKLDIVFMFYRSLLFIQNSLYFLEQSVKTKINVFKILIKMYIRSFIPAYFVHRT